MSGWTVHVLDGAPPAGSPARCRIEGELSQAVAGAAGSGTVVVDERAPEADLVALLRMLEASRDGAAQVGVRPVTDTIKRVRDGVVVGTVDRDTLVEVVGPLVAPYDVEPAGSVTQAVARLTASDAVLAHPISDSASGRSSG